MQAVLATKNLRRYTVQDVRRVVEQNDKQRFSLKEDAEAGLLIRANQGHSLQVRADCDSHDAPDSDPRPPGRLTLLQFLSSVLQFNQACKGLLS